MQTEKLTEELTKFFNQLREDGMVAIALSESENGRMKLLGLMQYSTRQEIVLKKIVKDLEHQLNLDILVENRGVVDETELAKAGTNIKIVSIDAD